DNGSNALVWDPESLVVEAADGPEVRTLALTATDAGTVASLTSDAPWLSVTSPTVSLPGTVEVRVDPAGLAGGTHTGRLTATADGAVSAVLTVSLLVDAAPGLVVDPGALSVTAFADGAPVGTSLVVSASDGS